MLDSFPQLVFEDVKQYVAAAERTGEKIDEAAASLLMAKAAHTWLLQTIGMKTGGPTLEQVITVCRKAKKYNPENEFVNVMLSDTLRRDGQLHESLEIAEKALADGATYSLLMQHIVSLHLALGDMPSATAANDLMQKSSFPDDSGARIQKETAEMMALAEDLDRHLKKINFVSQTGKAMVKLLATSADTAKAFEPDVATALANRYDSMRSRAANVSLKAGQTQLRYECVTTAKLRAQNSETYEFDENLAAMANDLKEGHYWFTVHCKNPETAARTSYAYFVKLGNGWRIFPKP